MGLISSKSACASWRGMRSLISKGALIQTKNRYIIIDLLTVVKLDADLLRRRQGHAAFTGSEVIETATTSRIPLIGSSLTYPSKWQIVMYS